MSRQPDCDCETVVSPTTRRAGLGLGTLAVLIPWLVASSPNVASQQARAPATGAEQSDDTPTPASVRQVVLTVEGMTCAACPKIVRTALTEIDGVYEVEATYEPPQVIVRFDPNATSVEVLMQATKQVGYSSHPHSS